MLVRRDGQLVVRLEKGPYVYWKTSRQVEFVAVDRREQTSDVAGQEIMTRDKVTLRVNLVVTWQVVDAAKTVEAARDVDRALYREAQLALRGAIGTRTLDQLLSDKETVSGEVEDAITARAPSYGVVVRSVGLRDVILPGDMKAILKGTKATFVLGSGDLGGQLKSLLASEDASSHNDAS